MKKIHSVIAVCLSFILVLALSVPVFASETITGTPTVEINLGADNAGAEFYFKTDAGIMPGTLTADENGVVSVELGDSSRYILTYAGASSAMPQSETADETEPESGSETEETTVIASEPASEETGKIPVKELCIFLAGLVLIGGFLIFSKVSDRRKRKKTLEEDDAELADDEEEEDYE